MSRIERNTPPKGNELAAKLVLSTCPNVEDAERIAHTLVTEQLAACVSIIPQLTSIYQWQGRIEQSNEVQLLIKSEHGKLSALEARLNALHPYEVAEFLVVPIESGSSDYLAWIGQCLTRDNK